MMMSSNTNLDLTQSHENWAIRIWDTLSATEPDLEHPRTVCICVVPESLRCSKKEAFIPQFVGLGPYHHFRADLIMTEQKKLAAAKRVLRNLLPRDMALFRQRISNFGSDIHTFYHPDVNFTYNHHTLSFLLAVDGLFLLAFITLLTSSSTGGDPDNAKFSNFLTGNLRMLLFNAAGVELTKSVLIREVFMLENQIPFHVLEQISGEKIIQSESNGEGLRSNVENFCKQHCPLVKLQVFPNDTIHLLDLMYHLIVPRPQPQPQPQAVPVHEPQPAEPNHEPRLQSRSEEILSVVLDAQWSEILIVPVMLIFIPTQIIVSLIARLVLGQHFRELENYGIRLFESWNEVGMLLLIELSLPVYFVFLILRPFLWLISSIFPPIKRVFNNFFRRRNFSSVLRWLHGGLSNMEGGVNNPLIRSLTLAVANLYEITERRQSTDSDKGAPWAERIPSVVELHKAGIFFKPAESGITSIDFDDEECVFYLPSIRLDVNSEVIIRNLVAYETLIKSNTPLVFTRYLELMNAILVTPEDVQLLVDTEIIKTKLWNENVVELFKGMNKSIRPTTTSELDKVVRKVKAKFDNTQKRINWVVIKHMSGTFFAVIGCLLFLAFMGLKTYCTVFNCSGTSEELGKLPQDGGYYGRSNYFISSV